MDNDELKRVLEALIFASDSAVSADSLANVVEGVDKKTIKAAVAELMEEYKSRSSGILIEEVAGGYQLRTNPESAPWLRRLFKIGLQRISKAAMETLAIVAYRQPVTRGEVEAVRGVDSGAVLATLMEKRFIKITGRKEVPGRPVVYGTTKEFLETFDLKDLSCLPSLKEISMTEDADGAAREGTEGASAAGGAGAEGLGTQGPGGTAAAGGEVVGEGEVRPTEPDMAAGEAEGAGAAGGEVAGEAKPAEPDMATGEAEGAGAAGGEVDGEGKAGPTEPSMATGEAEGAGAAGGAEAGEGEAEGAEPVGVGPSKAGQ